MKSYIPLIVSSCDKCSDLWLPFFTLVKKYWTGFNRKVFLCTDSKTFEYEGIDIECPLRMPMGSTWSENLMSLLKQIKEDYVLLILDDFWLKTKVDVDQLNRCEEIMINDPAIGFICLIHQLEPSVDNPISKKYPDLIEYGLKTPYRVTTQAGLWRRDYLLSLLRKHESAWWFEMFGSIRSRKYQYISCVVLESVFSYDDGGVLFRGRFVNEYVKYFKENIGFNVDSNRPIADKDTLMAEVKGDSFFKKLNPLFVYHYCKSHF